jgi:hypothetical protein
MDCIKRSISLMAWKEVDEVQPYYCEGLIHLKGMFESNTLVWEGEKLTINKNNQTIEALKKWYIDTYKKLALHYLNKKDALEFLKDYAIKENNHYYPVDKNIKDFVVHYFKRYQEIGQELDTQDKKENYL